METSNFIILLERFFRRRTLKCLLVNFKIKSHARSTVVDLNHRVDEWILFRMRNELKDLCTAINLSSLTEM